VADRPKANLQMQALGQAARIAESVPTGRPFVEARLLRFGEKSQEFGRPKQEHSTKLK
jgi:hypothetical protein